jgi:hypothetical protein
MRERSFPFVPRSAAKIRPGDFWSIPLRDGRYGCGRVIELKKPGETGSRCMLLCGLLNWIGNAPPNARDIAGRRTIAQGQIHLRCILETGGEILGTRPLELDGIQPGRFLSESPGGNCRLMTGYSFGRIATPTEQETLPVFPTWGYLVIRHRAEKLAQDAA